MRILWVKAGRLLPVDTGGKIRSYNILRSLAARHETTLLSYYLGERDEAYHADLEREFPGAVAVPMGSVGGAIGQLMHYAARFPRPQPYSITKFTHPAVTEQVAALLQPQHVDVAVCDFLAASLNFPSRLPVPTVLFQHNVESALWARQARYERNPAKRLVFQVEATKMRHYEREAIARFSKVIAVSNHDRDLMHQLTPGCDITVVPTGVDVEHFRFKGTRVSPKPVVMFLGSMDWPANIDGVEHFCAEIWPAVLAAVPDATFQVVGRNPPSKIQALASDSVEIVGGVKSVLPHLHSAAVFVVPLRIGGGTRLKIYEAMAAGCPIVSTRVGAEGLDVTDGEDIVLADAPTDFASSVIGLLEDEPRRRTVSEAAFKTASRFDWSSVALAFEDALARTAGDGTTA